MHNLTALSLALPGTPLHGLSDFQPAPARRFPRTVPRSFACDHRAYPMATSRSSYAATTRRDRLPVIQRVSLRLRGRVRRRRSVQALLDERAQLLAALERLDEARAKVAMQTTQRGMQKPAARERIEEMSQKWQAKIDSHAERIRHRLVLGDGILSSRGVKPWEHAPDR